MTGPDLLALSIIFYPGSDGAADTSLSARAGSSCLTETRGVRLRQLGGCDARDWLRCRGPRDRPEAAQAEELEDASDASAAYFELL